MLVIARPKFDHFVSIIAANSKTTDKEEEYKDQSSTNKFDSAN